MIWACFFIHLLLSFILLLSQDSLAGLFVQTHHLKFVSRTIESLAGHPQMQVLLYLFSEDTVNTLCIPAFEDTSIWMRSVFLPNVNARGYVFTQDIPSRGSGNRAAISLLRLVSYTWHHVFEVHLYVLSVLNTYLSACARRSLFFGFFKLSRRLCSKNPVFWLSVKLEANRAFWDEHPTLSSPILLAPVTPGHP